MTRLARRPFVAAIAALACLTATACSHDGTDRGVPAGSFKLVFFDSCEQALAGLRTAATSVVGPWGFGGDFTELSRDGRAVAPQPANAGAGAGAEAPAMAPPPAGDAAKAGAGTADYSGTNTHEAGVDEPDLVKTDGKRIITVSAGRLTVVDAGTRRLIGAVDLGESMQGQDANLLLAGDHALVLGNQAAYRGVAVEDSAGNVANPSDVVSGTSLILVDLTGPRVISRGRADGSIVDARQVGSVARIVVRSYPRLEFPMTDQGTEAERIAANKAIINASGIDDWLPRLEVTTGGRTSQSQVGCEAVSRPAIYSGTNLLTVLSFDLGQEVLSSGQPVSIVADGDTVYSNGPSLYVASNPAWRVMPMAAGDAQSQPQQHRTEIYKFDTSSGSERPRYVAGGSVPGHVLNQYSMSEWDGRLRVASTTDSFMDAGAPATQSNSGVYVLAQDGQQLVQVGAVEGLGKGERIYSVRFVGTVGYVVTFRQTDPLYTLDLGDPAKPTVRGELKIPGYSAYLHPAEDNRLIGVGQDATNQGQVTGTQVSLFRRRQPCRPGPAGEVHAARHLFGGGVRPSRVPVLAGERTAGGAPRGAVRRGHAG